MPEVSEYEPGTPSWVDLGSPDVEGSRAFYGGLFGWEAQMAPQPEAGGYGMFTLGGKTVAGVGPLMTEGRPPAWVVYISVADADATAEAVRSAYGKVLLEPMDVFEVGRMAVFADPAGAVISVWQPRLHRGAQLMGEPGTMCWHELATRDVEGAESFYSAVLGWRPLTRPYDGTTYTEWQLGERTVAGMIRMDENWPPDLPPHWMVYFAVEDCDASAARASELGGQVSVPPTDIPPGRFAVLGDPQGAYFSILKMSPRPPT